MTPTESSVLSAENICLVSNAVVVIYSLSILSSNLGLERYVSYESYNVSTMYYAHALVKVKRWLIFIYLMVNNNCMLKGNIEYYAGFQSSETDIDFFKNSSLFISVSVQSCLKGIVSYHIIIDKIQLY